MEKKQKLTTEAGAPVGDNQNIQTAGPHGPALLQNVWLIEKLAHFNRERIPERIVHAKGSGAFGTFTAHAGLASGVGHLGVLRADAHTGGQGKWGVWHVYGDE